MFLVPPIPPAEDDEEDIYFFRSVQIRNPRVRGGYLWFDPGLNSNYVFDGLDGRISLTHERLLKAKKES